MRMGGVTGTIGHTHNSVPQRLLNGGRGKSDEDKC